MALTNDDKQWIKGAITEGVVDALSEVVLPRFDEHEKRLNAIDTHLDTMDSHLRNIDGILGQHDGYFREIRADIREIGEKLGTIDGCVEALEADIKELYFMQTGRQNSVLTDKKFSKLPLEKKILVFNSELIALAKQAGVTLPRN
ncbi:MAG TPA: hypothetical protein VFQ70_01895 [Candidatus Saccharimonadaceae bacterium]|nr:hypothetical protein [Candidatus Saccharimonadaceae bacterium]